AFEAPHHFFQPGQGAFKIRFFLRFRFFCSRLVHAIRQSCLIYFRIPTCLPISGNARSNTSTARPVPPERSAFGNGGKANPRAGMPARSFPIPETTTSDRESRAQDPHNILVHAGERTQSLYGVSPI